MATAPLEPSRAASAARWAKLIDHTRCIGCHACSTACKSENEVPVGVHRTYVKYVDVGRFPNARRAFQVTRCNQCENAPCAVACPTAAMYRRADGIVDFDKNACIGCKACIAACPYDAIFINPDDGGAEKCNFCAHRLDVGLEPACVTVCPTEAILVGDLEDPGSRVARAAGRDVLHVRKPEKNTRPKLFYKGAHAATLDPLAARRPDGGLFLWSEQQGNHAGLVGSGAASTVSSAAALLSYDVPHQAPWGWRVSLYTWTKGIAAGAYLAALIAGAHGALWAWGVPILAGFFLALTGLLLIADLKRPERFYLIFTRPQWKSWLTRGAVVITLYTALLVAHFLGSVFGLDGARDALVVPGALLAAATAAYTAWLFAQAHARDLWQSPLLLPQLLVQAVLVGSAALLPVAAFLRDSAERDFTLLLAVAAVAHLVCVAGEVLLPHPTAHARQAVAEMTRGRYAALFWSGLALQAAGVFTGALGAVPAALLVLAGVLLYEHAYVQSAQSVPLA
jgi:Fe-S-cluster-containing dehydrogenase component